MHPALLQAAALGLSLLSSLGGLSLAQHRHKQRRWHRKWKNRLFQGHPEANLRNIATESARYKGMEVRMEVTLWFNGGYGVWWEKIPYSMRTKRGNNGFVGPLKLEGPLERVLEDLITWVTDDDTGLMRWDSTRKIWKDEDSPLIFKVSLSVRGVRPRRERVVIDVEPEPEQIPEQPQPKRATLPELMDAVHAALEAEGLSEEVDVSRRKRIAEKAKRHLQGLG